jgi:hypothetical protein
MCVRLIDMIAINQTNEGTRHLFHLKGAQSFSDSTETPPNGRNVELAMFACSRIRSPRKFGS